MSPNAEAVTSYRLVLPWQRRPLHANQSLHYFARAKIVAQVRSDVFKLAIAARLPKGAVFADVTLTWRPPDRRVTDTQNLAPLLKACVDGLVLGRGGKRGYGLVADDSPEFLSSRPALATPGRPGALWLDVEVTL